MREPLTALRSSLSAPAILSAQKYGISALTSPASSMNAVLESYSRAFHER